MIRIRIIRLMEFENPNQAERVSNPTCEGFIIVLVEKQERIPFAPLGHRKNESTYLPIIVLTN